MIVALATLIEHLEDLDLREFIADPEAMLEAAEVRGEVVEALQALDLSGLTPEERAEFRPRLAQVIERDAQLPLLLEQAREVIAKGLNQLSSGRAGIRAYGAQYDCGGALTKRVG